MPSTTVLLELTVRFRLARGLRNFFTCGKAFAQRLNISREGMSMGWCL